MNGAILGTPEYMSPEQAEGRIDDVNERSDVFSLGGILYAILTLRSPVVGDSVEEILNKVKSGQIAPPSSFGSGGSVERSPRKNRGDIAMPADSELLPHCPSGSPPAALSAVAMRALSREPGDRYAAVSDLAGDIEAYRSGFATSAEDLSFAGQFALLIGRHRTLATSTGVAAALIAIISVGFMLKVMGSERKALASAAEAEDERGKAERERDTADLERRRAMEEERKAIRALGESKLALAEAAYVNHDAAAMVRELQDYPEALRATNSTWQYLWNQRDASIGDLPYDLPENEGGAVFIPGMPGRLAVARPGAVHFMDLLDGSLKQSISTTVTNACLAFSGDGRIMAASSSDSRRVSLFDAVSGGQRGYIRIPYGAQTLTLNRDGSLVAVSLIVRPGGELDRVEFYETSGGAMIRGFDVNRRHVIAFHPDGQTIAIGAYVNYLALFRQGEPDLILEEKNKRINSLEFSPDGRMLALTTFDGYLRLLDPETGRQINATKVFRTGDARMVWASDEHLVTHAPSRDGNWLTRIWAADGLIPVKTFFGAVNRRIGEYGAEQPAEWIFDRQTGYLVSAGAPAGISRMPIGLEHRVLPVETGGASLAGSIQLAVALPTENLVLASGRPLMTLHDISKDPRRLEFDSVRKGAIASVHHGRGLIAQAGRFSREPAPLRMFALRDGVPERVFDAPLSGGMIDLCFNRSGDKILLFRRDGSALEVFTTTDGTTLSKIRTPDLQRASHALFVGDGEEIVIAVGRPSATGGEESVVLKLDAESGRSHEELVIEQGITSMAASPDGSGVAIGLPDGSVMFLRAEELGFQNHLRAHDDAVSMLAYHPNQPHIATASTDLSVKVWNYETGALLNHYLGISSRPNDLEFSPSGDLLALIDNGESVRIWKLAETRVARRNRK